MQLSFSNEALSSVPLSDLRRGARRRNLEGLELAVETSKETRPGFSSIGTGPSNIDEGRPPVQWLLLDREASLPELLYWSRQAHLIGAGLVLRKTAVETPLCVPLALLHRTDAAAAQRAAAWARMHDASTAWEVNLHVGEEGQFEEVLDATAGTLAHVRVRGAGPEVSSGPKGRPGMGALLKKLVLRGYTGTIALAPAAQGTEQAWREWLVDGRGWDCNTAAEKKAAR